VLTCLQAPFVPPRRLIAAVPEAITITPEHSLPPFPLNHFHRTDHLALEGGDHSLTAIVQQSFTITVFYYEHLRRNRFQLHVPLPQGSTVTSLLLKTMAGTRKRTTACRSSTTTVPRSMIQILQSRAIPILEPVNLEENDVVFDATYNVHTSATLDVTTLPPPLVQQ